MRLTREAALHTTLIVGVILTALAIAAAWLNIAQLTGTVRMEERAVTVLGHIDRVRSAYLAAQAWQGRYLDSGDAAAEGGFTRRRAEVSQTLAELEALAADSGHRGAIADLATAVNERLASGAAVISERKARGEAAARGLQREGRDDVDAIEALFADVITRERAIIAERTGQARDTERVTRALLLWGGALSLLTFGALAFMLYRYQGARDAALAQLGATQRRLALALEGSALAVWDWDIERDLVFLDRAWAQIIGAPEAETIASTGELLALVPEDEVATVRAAFATAIRSGVGYDIEHRVRTRGGEYRWIASRGIVTERTPDGRARRMTGTNRDITARRRAEEALAAQELQLRVVIDNVPVMIVDVDANDRYRYCNRRYADFFGHSAEALVGRTVREVIGEQGYIRFSAAVAEARKGEAVTYERPAAVRGRDAVELEVRVVPQMRAQRGYQGCYVLLTDVTERKRLAAMQEDFVANVSHELRTPLTAIRASLSMLAHGSAGELTPKAAGLVNVAHSSCERLVRLVNQVLDFQKARRALAQGALPELAAIDLAGRAIKANESYAAEHGVSLRFAGGEPGLRVLADADYTIQALTNLLANAVRYSPRGELVELGIEPRSDRVRFSVRDHGAGVPETFRSRLFEPFAQADPGTSGSRNGTGLGLAITKSIVEHMGGTVGYEPPADGGSLFWLDLVRAPESAAPG
jgi:PAS domain S-box-containing protein